MVLWRIGTVVKREGGSDFYAVPCFTMALGMTNVVLVLAFLAASCRGMRFPPVPLPARANSFVLILLTSTWRTPALTYGAVFAVVSATYLTLFSVGRSDPANAYILGLVAVLEGLGFWRIGLVALRSGRPEPVRIYARPLFISSLLLTVLAIPAGLTSPVTMAVDCVRILAHDQGASPMRAGSTRSSAAVYGVLSLTLIPPA